MTFTVSNGTAERNFEADNVEDLAKQLGMNPKGFKASGKFHGRIEETDARRGHNRKFTFWVAKA